VTARIVSVLVEFYQELVDRTSLEDPPRLSSYMLATTTIEARISYNSAEDLGDKQRLHILRREEDGGEACNAQETGDDRIAVAKLLRNDAVDEKTDDLADIGSLSDGQSELANLTPGSAPTLLNPACQGAGT